MLINTKAFGFDINLTTLPQVPNLYIRIYKFEIDIVNFKYKDNKVHLEIGLGLK